MYIYIILIIIASIALYVYYNRRKITPYEALSGEKLKDYNRRKITPYEALSGEKLKDYNIKNLSYHSKNINEMIIDSTKRLHKNPIITKTRTKSYSDDEILSQLTVYDNGTIEFVEDNTIKTVKISPDEINDIKNIIEELYINPIHCCADIPVGAPMIYVTIHNTDNSKTFTLNAIGSCMISTRGPYDKISGILDNKLNKHNISFPK